MQTAENQTKPNQTQTDITVEEFAQSILTAEEHLSGVSVETVFHKGKRFPVFKTTGGVPVSNTSRRPRTTIRST